ncbi:MAG TPA: pentapeptide repeat-containing protein [Allosphingosinicella sp.]|nr:pentapeptide repeat-containing protein [Allosphingosinicella sp.]
MLGIGVVEGQTFVDCDFQGFFVFKTQMVIKGCSFEGCDLALTTWENVKFSSCTFRRSSIGQTTFRRCEFRQCHWEDIGFSSNETSFEHVLVTNPENLVASAYTNLDPQILSTKGITPQYQLYKLEGTRSTIARLLLRNLQDVGDEQTYYQAVKVFELHQAKARWSQAWYEFKFDKQKSRLRSAISAGLWFADQTILRLFGALNGWGASVARPLSILVGTIFVFAMIYALLDRPEDDNPLLRSFDIAVLAGYTNYGSASGFILFLQAFQLSLSVILYTVGFATIVSRFSRVRG